MRLVGRDLTILFFGIAAGALIAVLIQRAKEQCHEENFQNLAERVDERLHLLESANQPA